MNKTNIEHIAAQLVKMKSRLNWADREAAAIELRKSVNTINNYLNRKVSDEPFALELLKFLKQRIDAREQLLDELIGD